MTLPGFDLFFILDHFYLANIERVKQLFLAQYDEQNKFSDAIKKFIFEFLGKLFYEIGKGMRNGT